MSGSSRIRLCTIHTAHRSHATYAITADEHVMARLAALHSFVRGLERGDVARAIIRPPKPYQRHRLIQLLHVHDGQSDGATAREIAYSVLFPRHEVLIGVAWKASSERRHTLRAIADARRMVERDYRKLLLRA